VITQDSAGMPTNIYIFVVKFYSLHKWRLLVYFAIFIPVGVFKFFMPSFSGFGGSDEFSTIAGAAFVAGLDWSRVVSLTPYYGFGFSIFLFPVFLFDLSTFEIFLIMRIVTSALAALNGVIAYNITTRIFEVSNLKLAVVTSIAAACFGPNLIMTNAIFNDSMLIFLNWVILYILLSTAKRTETSKPGIAMSILLSAIMGYGLLVHHRVIFIWGAVFIFLLCYLAINRKIPILLRVFLPSFIVFFLLARFFENYVQSALWLAYARVLDNTADSLAWVFSRDAFLNRFSVSGLIAFIRMIIGETHTAFVRTAGLATLLFVALTFCLICLIYKKTRVHAQKIVKENKLLFMAITYTITQMAAIILLTAYSQTTNIQSVGADVRWLLYTRYWATAAAPVILLSVVLFCNIKKQLLGKLMFITGVFLVILNILFSYLVAPLLFGVATGSMSSYFSLTGMSSLDTVNTPTRFLIATLVAGVATLLLYSFAYKRKLALTSMLVLAFFLYDYSYGTINHHIPISQRLNAEVMHVVALFNNAGITAEEHPYVYERPIWANRGHVQFNLYRHRIIPIMLEDYYPFVDTSKIPIYVTNSVAVGSDSFNMFFGKNHKLVDFSENEISRQMLINADELDLISSIESAGYDLSAFDTLIFGTDTLLFCQLIRELAIALPFLAPRNIQLGSQLHLPAGQYEVTITGRRLLGARFSAKHSAREQYIDIHDINRTDNMVTYSFTLESNERQIEFLTTNYVLNSVEIENIRLHATERLPTNQISFAESILFDSRNRNFDRFYIRGLSDQERAGVWTSGHKTEFMFHVPDTLSDLVFAFTATSLGSQRIELEANGMNLGFMEINVPGTYEVIIPSTLIQDSRLHIAFILPTATSPRELGIGEDSRVLALFFEEMMFSLY